MLYLSIYIYIHTHTHIALSLFLSLSHTNTPGMDALSLALRERALVFPAALEASVAEKAPAAALLRGRIPVV